MNGEREKIRRDETKEREKCIKHYIRRKKMHSIEYVSC